VPPGKGLKKREPRPVKQGYGKDTIRSTKEREGLLPMYQPQTLFLAAVLLLPPALLVGQNSTSDFNTFFDMFKTAVAQKDTVTIKKLMASRFNFIHAVNVRRADVFEGLDSDNGQQWTNLQQAVQGTPVTYNGDGPYKNSRMLQCVPNQMIYECLVVFQKDSQNLWQWKAMAMPTR